MLIYFSTSKQNPEKIMQEVQFSDLFNTYINPDFVFGYAKGEFYEKAEEEARKDLLSVCDKLIIDGEPTPMMLEEIAFAKLVGMETEYR